MKPFTRNLFVFVLGITLLSAVSSTAQNIQITSLNFPPPAATNCTNTFLDVNTLLLCINAVHGGNVVSVSGFNITVDINYTIGPICLGALSMPTHNVNLGMLPPGTYSVTVNGNWNASTLSTSTASLSVTACCPAVPSFTVSNDTICVGDSIGFSNTSTGFVAHEWFENNISVGTTTDYGKRYSVPGVYDIKLVVTDGFCSDSLTKSVLVSNYPKVDLGVDTSICSATSIVLNAGTGYDSIRWSNMATSQFITVNTGGLYHVKVFENGCESRDTVNVGLYVPKYVYLGKDTAVCEGESVTFNAATFGIVGYRWQDNSTSATFTATTTGDYWVIAEDGNSCETSDTVHLEVHTLPVVNLGADTVMCVGDTLLLDATLLNATYLWQDASTNATLSVVAAGTYAVDVTDSNGCVGNGEINVSYDSCGVGIDHITDFKGVVMHPNPAGNTLYIGWNNVNPQGNYRAQILDVSGRLLYEGALTRNSQAALSIDVSGLEAGVYLITISGEKESTTRRFVKQ
jgi:hypothetical protein